MVKAPILPGLPHVDRRRLLVGAAVGGGLLVGWRLLPRSYPLPIPAAEGESVFDAWLRIGKDGTVIVAVPQLEMGQGISTILPQIVAMELGADWRHVAAQPVPVSESFINAPLAARWAEMWMPLAPSLAEAPDGALARYWATSDRFTATADGTSLAAYEPSARAAAASARCLLAMAAARRWGVDWQACEAADSHIRHGTNRASFAELAEDAAKLRPPSPPPLRARAPADELGAVPAPLYPRLDSAPKLTGSWQFAGDVRLPDMLYAAIRHAPRGAKAKLGAYDASRARGIAGFLRLVAGEDWLAAVASDWWAAERALSTIAPHFETHLPADSTIIEAALDKGLKDGAAHRMAALGDADALLVGPATMTRRYDVAPALHATSETATATAHVHDRGWLGHRVELWVATQAPERTRVAVAHALGIGLHDVVLYPLPAGGSFDARLETPQAIEAALISREAGRPVQLIWSRWQEHVATPPRAPVAAVMTARTDPEGGIAAWRARIAAPATTLEQGRRLLQGQTPGAAMAAQDKPDPLMLEGAMVPYAIPALAVDHVPVAIGLPTGRQRGNAHGFGAFFTECFIDELAVSQAREPLSYRMAMLAGDTRLAQCLQRVSALAAWNGGHDSSGQGLACYRMGDVATGGCIAAVATARRGDNGVRVDKISAVVDIGRIINLDIARQQIEGGLIFGLGLALGASTAYAQGLPVNGRLADLGLPGIGDCPALEVEFIASAANPVDPGELGVAVAPPAIANALFSATGVRFRRLPLASEE